MAAQRSPVTFKFTASLERFETAKQFLAGGVSSNFRSGKYPLFFERAEGSKLYDVDGNEFIDYTLGMGPVILGHAFPPVIRAVSDCLAAGQLYAGQHDAEVNLARDICRIIPCAEKVRFNQSGSEAIQAALRLARAFTRRPRIIKFEGHYHGWFDNIYVSVNPDASAAGPSQAPHCTPHSLGQSPNAYERDVTVLPWNDVELITDIIRDHGRDIAAVIMEPILCNTGVILPRAGYLEKVRELCTTHGIVLIFDEIITGFRVGLTGAQGLLGITPDLATFAKAMANGFPISCLAGKNEIMELIADGSVMHGGTFNSNLMSCVAALATLAEVERDDVDRYAHIEKLGAYLMERLKGQKSYPKFLVQGLGAVFNLAFTGDLELFDYRHYGRCNVRAQKRFVELLMQNGVRVTNRGTWFLSASHTMDDVETTLEAVSCALRVLAEE